MELLLISIKSDSSLHSFKRHLKSLLYSPACKQLTHSVWPPSDCPRLPIHAPLYPLQDFTALYKYCIIIIIIIIIVINAWLHVRAINFCIVLYWMGHSVTLCADGSTSRMASHALHDCATLWSHPKWYNNDIDARLRLQHQKQNLRL